MAGHAVESRRRRAGSTLAAFFLGSIAVHAAVLVALPGHGPERGLPNSVAVLEVVLLRADPLAAVPHDFAPRPILHPLRSDRPKAAPELQDRQGAPVLALSEPRKMGGASFTVEPARVPEPTVTAPAQGPLDASVATQPAGFNAAYLRNPAPRYPVAARRAGEHGTVTLRVRVARDGNASRVAVEKSSGSPHLDAAALEAVKAWRFTPARRGADAVESWMLVPIVFRLEGNS
ncbi:MAG: TonB family protein [Burkholderiales bacterium]